MIKEDEIKEVFKLIDNVMKRDKKLNGMSAVYIDDNIILNDLFLTKACILFDNIKVNHINPNLYIKTIYKDFDFDKVEKKFKDKGLKMEKVFYGEVDNCDYINFIHNYKMLVEEDVLVPHVYHNLPVLSSKTDKEIMLSLLDDKNSNLINLVSYLDLKREKNTFCLDEPLLYILKLICINQSFIEGVINKKVVLSEKRNIVDYVLHCNSKNESINIFNPNKQSVECCNINTMDLESSINSLMLDTFNLLVPDFPALNSEEILEVRYKLRDELGAYRLFMKDIMNRYTKKSSYCNSEIIQKEVISKVNDINLKLKSEKGKLFKRIVADSVAAGSALALTNCDIRAIIASSIGVAGKYLWDIEEFKDNKMQVTKQSDNLPFIFLIKANKLKEKIIKRR